MLASTPFRLTAALLCTVMLNGIAGAQEAKLATLLDMSPSPANSIGYLHNPSLKKLIAEANLPALVSESMEEVWLVSELDRLNLHPRWEAGYATMLQSFTADQLSKALNGYVDQVAGKDVVWTPKQSYLLPLDANRLGFLRPADRSLLAEWLSATPQARLPTYLAEAAKQPEQYLSLMVAIDLKDVFSPVTLADHMANFESLKSQDPKVVADVLSSVQGLSLIVGRKSLSECILSIEFAKSPANFAPVATALLNEILNRNGTSAPEVTSWKAKVEGNKLSFHGAISADSLDGVLGIFSVSNHADQVAASLATKAQAGQPTEKGGATGAESKAYFDKVNLQIERVRKYEAQTTGYRAKWNDMTARRIDELGTLYVDPQMIEYGADVSSLLRGNALTIRSGNVSAGQTEAAESLRAPVSYGYSYGWGGGYGYGTYNPNSTTDYQRVTSAQQRGAAFGDYRKTLSQIDQLTANIRRLMTEKYSLQF